MTAPAFDALAEAHRHEIEAEPLDANLGVLVARAAERYADRPFWVSIDGQAPNLGYREFDRLANRAANAFAGLGVGRAGRVAVMLPNIWALPVIWVGLARLGAVMVPLNTAFTPGELRVALAGSDPRLLVIHPDHLAVLAGIEDRHAILADDRVIVCGEPPAPFARDWFKLVADASPRRDPQGPAGTDDPVSIQFTSGTTGFPKGCLLGHRYWLIIGKVLARRGPAVERILTDLPLYYLGAQWRVWMALYGGSTLYVALRYSLHRLIERTHAFGIDFVSMVDQVAKLPPDPRESALRLKRISIAHLDKDLHRAIERRFGAPAREGYGMTETGATLYMPFDDARRIGSGSCGIPAPFRECMIADRAGRPCPPGETGELWVKGPGIFQGYYGDPEATASAFRGDWFSTGDLFRQDADGYFYMVGRIKDMIRRSGENIAAVEVESVLRAMPEVREAAVVAVDDPFRGEEVKAYVALAQGLGPEDVPPARIFAHCAQRLAAFKVPRYLEYVGTLPHTGSNKIAKPALRAAKADLRQGSFDRVDQIWR